MWSAWLGDHVEHEVRPILLLSGRLHILQNHLAA
jgi:hypothetical protein